MQGDSTIDNENLQPSVSLKRKKLGVGDSREKVRVMVVEDHHHVLEHIHTALRQLFRKSAPNSDKSWSMLHVDAHPDCKFISCLLRV